MLFSKRLLMRLSKPSGLNFFLLTTKKLLRDKVFGKLSHGTQFDLALGNHALRAELTD